MGFTFFWVCGLIVCQELNLSRCPRRHGSSLWNLRERTVNYVGALWEREFVWKTYPKWSPEKASVKSEQTSASSHVSACRFPGETDFVCQCYGIRNEDGKGLCDLTTPFLACQSRELFLTVEPLVPCPVHF